MTATATVIFILLAFPFNSHLAAYDQSGNISAGKPAQIQALSLVNSVTPFRQEAENPLFLKSDSLPSGVTKEWLNKLRDENGNRIMEGEFEQDFIQRKSFSPLGPSEGFGGCVSSAGDVNGDGFNDIIIGALHYNTDVGRAYIFYGGANWDPEPDVILRGEAVSEFGSSVSSGDFNADGYSDVVIGAHRFNSGTGRAYIYYGGASMDTTADVILTGEGINNFFGQHFSSTGDVNNDGYSDLVIGAYGFGSNGRAYVYLGGQSMDNSPDVIMDGLLNGGKFGGSASSAGDVNGDGYDDVMVGAYGVERAYIFYGGSLMNNSADVTLSGEGGQFGISVSTAGDVNGDGYDDVVVGAYRYELSKGKVYVYFGGNPMNNSADVTMLGEEPNALFGMAVASAGDLNRDGYSDIIVGAAHDFSPADTGKAYVFFGGASMNSIADVTMSGDGLADNFGVSVAATGDFNGDGYTELLVGASEFSSQRGRVYYYEYNVSGNISSDSVRKLIGPGANQGFGMSVSSAGDVNNDGFDDMIVGCTWNNSDGKAYLYFGGLVFDTIPDLIMHGESGQGSEFGKVVSTAGDVNGDGYSDVIVGAHFYNLKTGRAYVYLGGAVMDNVADITMTGEATDRYLGASVSSDDFNKDGFSDVLVGEPGYGSNTGRAHIFFGGTNMDNIPDVTMTGESTGNYFGFLSSPAGDVNGDSYPDVIIGATHYAGETGRAYIYFGGSTMNNAADLTLNGENGYFGSWLSSGDVNGDGYSDVIVGAYSYGSDDRGKVYIYHGGNPMNDSPDLIFLGKESGSLLGNTLAGVGDLNKDGYSDIILPENTKGRAYVHFGSALMDTVADIIKYQDTPGENFGFVSAGGDINGDGHLEYLVGAPSFNSATGKVYIYDYKAEGKMVADLAMTGENAGDYFGTAVSSAGDVNGDGYDDVIVGASEYSSRRGRAYIFFGGALSNNTPDLIISGETSTNDFGAAVSSAGDVNNDGFDDVIVGASSYNSPTGRAYIYFGGSSMDGTADVIMNGEGGNFGCRVSSAGDVNGDSCSDVIVGAYRYGANVGKAYIYLGGVSMNGGADITLNGYETDGLFGIAASSAGDVNRDGFSDVIIGAAHELPPNGSDTGKAYIFFGGLTMDNIPDVIMSGEQLADDFGGAVSSAGDVNGDGFSDVIVTAMTYNNIYDSQDGRAYIYYGGTLMDAEADVTLYGERTSQFGRLSPTSSCDMNGDGYSDVIIGAEKPFSATGRAYVYFGGELMNNLVDIVMDGEAVNNEFGTSVSSAGDFNNDGFSDVIVGAQKYSSNTGRAYIYLASAIGSPVNKRFRSKASGNWNTPLTWEMSSNGGSTWVHATSYPNSQSDTVTIRSSHTVSLTDHESVSRIIIDNGATLDLTTKTLMLSGDGTPLVKSGNLITANGTIAYNGASAQTLTSNVNFGNLTINNPSGVTVSSDFSVTGILSVTNGDLHLNGHTITLSGNASSLVETSGNTVTGASGSITTTRSISQPNSMNIGGLGAVVTSNENFGSTTITRRHIVQNVSAGVPSLRRHFTITPQNNSALNATFIFRYDPTELDTINESTLGIYRSTNGGLNFLPEGGIVDTAANQIVLNFVQSFSMFSAARLSDTLNNGLELTDNIYAKGKLCINWGTIDTVRVRINRTDIPPNDSIKIQYTIKNRETFQINFDTILTVPSFQQFDTLIMLRMPTIRQPGPHSVIVQAIPDELDPVNGFDIRTYCFDVTCDEFSYIEPCDTLDGGTGFDGSAGEIVAAFNNLNAFDPFPIHRIDHRFKNTGDGIVPYRLAVYENDSTGKPGRALYISEELSTPPGNDSVQAVSHIVNTPLEIAPLSRFYVGYIQVSSANIHVAYQNESPVRGNTFFFRNSFTNGVWTDFSDSSKNYRIDISPRTYSGSSSLSSLISLDLNAFLEGFYNSATKKMIPDTVRVEVRHYTQPYDKIDESKAVIDSFGTGVFHFSNVNPDTDYCFVIRHRNHIETWSQGGPQRLSTCGSQYDFTRSDSCAVGRNLFLIDSSPLRYAVYSGDVNQDGSVDVTDLGLIDNDVSSFTTGYVVTDLTGDNNTDISDLLIADNNASKFVGVIRP